MLIMAAALFKKKEKNDTSVLSERKLRPSGTERLKDEPAPHSSD